MMYTRDFFKKLKANFISNVVRHFIKVELALP